MTIPEEILRKPQNSFIAISSDAVIGQVAGALLALNGQPWWKILVRSKDGNWLGTTLGSLYYTLHNIDLATEMKIIDCPILEQVPSLDWESTNLAKAEDIASHNSSAIVALVKGEYLIGIIVSSRRDAIKPLSVGQLTELAGQYIDLKQYGAILLASSQNAGSALKKTAK